MKNNTESPSIQYLTDEAIAIFSEGNVLTEYRDIDLDYKSMVKPYPKGILDKRIFGSMFSNQCNCGQVREVGLKCPRCGSTVLDEVSAFRRYARIESPVYYCSELKVKKLLRYLNSNFSFKLELTTEDFKGRKKLDVELLEICQFIYDKSDNSIIVTDDIDNFFECSYEGLLQIIMNHFPEKVNVYSSYINTSILVVPIIMRPPHYTLKNGESELEMHVTSVVYQNIIYAIQVFYEQNFQSLKSEADKSLFRALLRKFITKSVSTLSGLIRSSKENMARVMQSNRLSNSGRCTIVPAPDLKVDEVYVPRHLMYEACREEFVDYIQNHYECSHEKAEILYKIEANSSAIQELFEAYINGNGKDDKGKYVIINRNPTLYEYNMMACKVKLTNDYTMGIPLLLCAPFGGDFDGDSMSFYCVPKVSTDLIVDEMSPRNLVYYKKNMKPLFTPSHEIMHGLIIATKCIMPEEIMSFDSIDDAVEYKKKHRAFKYQTVFSLLGKQTTIGREIFGEYFGTDLNGYLNGFDKHLTADNVIPLYCKLSDFEDRVDRIQKIQEFALLITTTSGATAPKLTDLYMDINRTYLDRMKEVEESKILSEKEKEIKIRTIYDEFIKEQTSKVDATVRIHIEESSRAKLSQLLSIMLPQLNVGPDSKAYVSNTMLINGQNPRDYEHHAIENRAVQDIKVSAVPMSGNLTRQFVFLASAYYFSEMTDEKNAGILMKKKDAYGRTLIDGTLVEKSTSDELVRVRSIVTSTYINEPIITTDMIPNLIKYKDKSRAGISMISSLTEGLTQAGLSLKHGGFLFNLDPLSKVVAPENVVVSLTDDWIVMTGKKIYKYPKPENFILNYVDGNKYKKGETVGVSYHIFTPAYKLDCVIELCEARKIVSKKKFAKNQVLKSECYAYNDGTIKYVQGPRGEIQVFIGDIQYRYNPESMYLFPDGAQVKKYDRICTGVLDLKELIDHLTDYVDAFYYFRLQFNELIGGMAPELIEFLFTLIVKRLNGKLTVKKVLSAIHESKSIYTTLAFEDPKKTLNKIGPSGIPFIDDTMTRVLLSLIVNNKII